MLVSYYNFIIFFKYEIPLGLWIKFSNNATLLFRNQIFWLLIKKQNGDQIFLIKSIFNLSLEQHCAVIKNAVVNTIDRNNIKTFDIGGNASTTDFMKSVIREIELFTPEIGEPFKWITFDVQLNRTKISHKRIPYLLFILFYSKFKGHAQGKKIFYTFKILFNN